MSIQILKAGLAKYEPKFSSIICEKTFKPFLRVELNNGSIFEMDKEAMIDMEDFEKQNPPPRNAMAELFQETFFPK